VGGRGRRAGARETKLLPHAPLVDPTKPTLSHLPLQSSPATIAAGPASVASALRAAHPEYRRRKEAIFHKMVARALAVVVSAAASGGGESGAAPASSSEFDSDDDASSDGDDDDSSDGGSSSSDVEEKGGGADAALDAEERGVMGEEAGGNTMAAPPTAAADAGPNAAMLRMYATAAAAEEAPDVVTPSLVAPGAAFAPPAAVAAAAARALAAEAAAAAVPAPAPAPAPAAPPTRHPGAPPPAKRVRTLAGAVAGTTRRTPPPPPSARRAGGPPPPPSSFTASPPRPITYALLGGMEAVLAQVRECVEYPLAHPEVYAWLGVHPPRGVLLHGPPGCGKTALAHAIANEAGVPFFAISAPEIVAGVSGESEAKLRDLFASAAAVAPAIIFIDEVDAIAPKREAAQREMERRIVAQLLTCMDDLAAGAESACGDQDGVGGEGKADGDDQVDWAAHAAGTEARRRHVVVIGATNRPDAIDPALRRAGRFDRELALGVPSLEGRAAILKVVTAGLRLGGALDLGAVAARTPGFVGADLAALAKEAAAGAVTRIFQQTEQGVEGEDKAGGGEDTEMAEVGAVAPATPSTAIATTTAPTPPAPPPPRLRAGPLTPSELSGLAITPADFEGALTRVQPSVRREGFASAPAATWADVGALGSIREELEFAVTRPIQDPARFAALGLAAPTGVLLYGPPGCGKTLLARAVAAESGANFVSIKGPELLNKWVGESEAAVRRLFARARAAAPCVVFFDELDALAPRRGGGGEEGGSGGQAAERVVNQLLTELDGLDGRGRVFVVGATNRPDIIDPALLRPGRLDKALYVPLPPPAGRADIIRTLLRKTPLSPGAGAAAEAVAASPSCDGFSGADLAALVREAAVAALREDVAAERAEVEAAGGDGAGVGAGPGARPSLDAAATAVRAPPRPPPAVSATHFTAALACVVPSVSKRDQRTYDALRRRLGAARPRLVAPVEENGGASAAPPPPPPSSDPVPELA